MALTKEEIQMMAKDISEAIAYLGTEGAHKPGVELVEVPIY